MASTWSMYWSRKWTLGSWFLGSASSDSSFPVEFYSSAGVDVTTVSQLGSIIDPLGRYEKVCMLTFCRIHIKQTQLWVATTDTTPIPPNRWDLCVVPFDVCSHQGQCVSQRIMALFPRNVPSDTSLYRSHYQKRNKKTKEVVCGCSYLPLGLCSRPVNEVFFNSPLN